MKVYAKRVFVALCAAAIGLGVCWRFDLTLALVTASGWQLRLADLR